MKKEEVIEAFELLAFKAKLVGIGFDDCKNEWEKIQFDLCKKAQDEAEEMAKRIKKEGIEE